MTALLRTLAIVASLFLAVQTVRHAYVLWLEPRTSVLDKFERPLRDEIAAAESVDVLMQRYEPVRKEVDRIKAERRAADPKAEFTGLQDTEPFKSEAALREAITGWEQRAKELHSLRFYWLVGLVFAASGMVLYHRRNRWTGVSLLIIGFSEIIYIGRHPRSLVGAAKSSTALSRRSSPCRRFPWRCSRWRSTCSVLSETHRAMPRKRRAGEERMQRTSHGQDGGSPLISGC